MKFVLAMLALLLAAETKAKAAVIIVYEELAGNVIATGSGTINLAALTFNSNLTIVTAVSPSGRYFAVGTGGSDVYGGTSGPTNFGAGGYTAASSGSGDPLGISIGFVAVPHGYTSGTAISGTAEFTGKTFSSLGLNPGTYIYTWGSGLTADSFTLQVGPAPDAVPEPSTFVLLGTPVLALGYFGRRRRQLPA